MSVAPRLIRPHPFTLQRVVALARGPLVYCLEDVDHPWVNDHFKSLVMAPRITQAADAGILGQCILEKDKRDLPLGETYVGVTLKKGGLVIPQKELLACLESKGLGALVQGMDAVDLHFVPYWARANRGGKSQMRVGITTLD